MNGSLGIVRLNSLESLLQLVEVDPDKGYGAGHIAIEAPAVHADRGVSLLLGHTGHYFHVGALASSCHSMHHKDDGNVVILRQVFQLVGPVQTNVPSVVEEYFFSLVLNFDALAHVGKMFVDGLKRVMEKKGRRLIDIGALLGLFFCLGSQKTQHVFRPF